MSGIKIIIGGPIFNPYSEFQNAEKFQSLLSLFDTHDINTIDSSPLYEDGEGFISRNQLGAKGFKIDTKTPGGMRPGSSTREGVVKILKNSLQSLGVEKVDVFYIHAPDREVDIEETLAGINDAYVSGLFERFGLSNFGPEEVVSIYELAKKKGWVKPSVYQGCFSPITRKSEEVLIPTLRKLGISFYAYSPLAGGILTKTKEQVLGGVGRFDRNHAFGKMYEQMFFKPAYLESLEEWASIARDEGVERAELAYRWVASSSVLSGEFGDGMILGSNTLIQWNQTLEGLERGALSGNAKKRIDEVWDKVKHEALLDNFEAILLGMNN